MSAGTVVVKYGGSAMGQGFQNVLEDVASLWKQGVKVVLVHGGGKEISALIMQLGIEPIFKDGLRVTDEKTLEAVIMVLAGTVNKRIVAGLQGFGIPAFGLTGVDGGMMQVHPKYTSEEEVLFDDQIGELGFVGDVHKVDRRGIDALTEAGFLPVVAPIGVNHKGQTFNINGDTAAGALAGALEAEKLILLTDVPGIMKETNGEKAVIPEITPDEIQQLIENGTIYGGMIPKVEACLSALNAGAKQVQILNGSEPGILLEQVKQQIGTTVVQDKGGL